MKCSYFIGMLFQARNVAHSVHLNTRSYSKHMALAGFYDEIVELTDKFAEAYQGRHGLIGPIQVPESGKTSNIVDYLQAQVEEIEEYREKLVDRKDTPLNNIIDEIVGLYLSTLYKLRFLA